MRVLAVGLTVCACTFGLSINAPAYGSSKVPTPKSCLTAVRKAVKILELNIKVFQDPSPAKLKAFTDQESPLAGDFYLESHTCAAFVHAESAQTERQPSKRTSACLTAIKTGRRIITLNVQALQAIGASDRVKIARLTDELKAPGRKFAKASLVCI